ncbi:MAG: cache domain-containing protein [Nakamurella sp.]
MTTSRVADSALYASTAEALVERVFGAVGSLREQVIDCRSAALSRHERLQARHLADIRPGLIGLLRAHRDIVVGMGMIVAPGLLPGERHRLEWWQFPAGRDHPSALQVDLNPESLGFYDYGSAEWFSVPRRTGRRHIVGPYVDALGTDRYLLTFTVPVLADGVFLGVVGADVPVSRFERHLLSAWRAGRLDEGRRLGEGGPVARVALVDPVGRQGRIGPAGRLGSDVQTDVLIINSQGRVVVSNCVRALSGDLLADDAVAGTLRLDLPDVPWRLLLSERLPS